MPANIHLTLVDYAILLVYFCFVLGIGSVPKRSMRSSGDFFYYWTCIFVSAAIVLVYIFLGGLTSAIYNEVLQFFMIVLGFAPLVYLGLRKVGGWSALKAQLIPVATQHVPPYAPGTWTHSWTHMGSVTDNPMGAIEFVFGASMLFFGWRGNSRG